MERPQLPSMPSKTPAWEALEQACESYMDEVESETGDGSSKKSEIVLRAMELVYGPKVWEWINRKLT